MKYGYAILLAIAVIAFVLLTYRPYELPKIVWTHWDTANLPDFQRLNLDRMRRYLPDWTVNFMTDESFATICPAGDFPPNYDALSKQHKADFIRLWLLKKHGGVWLDSSIVLNQSINDLHAECLSKKAELSGFYIEGTTTDNRWPVFENWFIMAPAHSRFIEVWYDEYCKAIASGFLAYKAAAKRDRVHFHNLLTDENDIYLTQHLCFQKVLQHKLPDSKIIYKRAEDTMFRIQGSCKWNRACINAAFRNPQIAKLPYFKLIGGDRPSFPLRYFALYE